MELNKVMEKRYSVRYYSDAKVENDKIEEILKVTGYAPSAVNYQPVRVLVVQSKEGLEKISKATQLYKAPLAFVVCYDKEVAWIRDNDKKNHGDIDASIMTDHMMLKATELGLGSVWICRYDPIILREELNIPNNLVPVNILAIGYPNEQSKPSKMHTNKREASEYIYWESI